MDIIGTVTGCQDGIITIQAPIEHPEMIARQHITQAEIRLSDGRRISPEQRRKTYALFRDISLHTGYTPEYIKELFKCLFLAETGGEPFSLSDVDMTTARKFITFLIDFCLEWDVPCMDSLLGITEDISHYLYKCLELRKCAICGKHADVHHIDAIGMGNDRKEKPQLGARCIALCRKHHRQCHDMGNESFLSLYHAYGIKLDHYLCRVLKIKE